MKMLLAALRLAGSSEIPSSSAQLELLSRARHFIFQPHVVLFAVVALVFTGSLIPHLDHLTHALVYAVTGAKTLSEFWKGNQ
jgi:hypothetical protein